MKDFYSEFIKYASQMCSKEDYAHKSRVWKNNRAVTKVLKMSSEIIGSDKEYACRALYELMKNDNEKVRLFAATICLQNGFFTDDAKQVLRKIATDSNDSIIAFHAEITLKTVKNKTGDGSMS